MLYGYSFVVHVKANYICIDIPEDVETRFDTNYEIDRLLSMGLSSDWINERWIRWTNHEKICSIKSKDMYLFKRQWCWI